MSEVFREVWVEPHSEVLRIPSSWDGNPFRFSSKFRRAWKPRWEGHQIPSSLGTSRLDFEFVVDDTTPWTIAYWTCSRTKSLLRIVSTSLNVLIKEIGIDRPRFTLLLQVTIGIDRQFPNLLTDQWAYSIGYCPGCGRYLVGQICSRACMTCMI